MERKKIQTYFPKKGDLMYGRIVDRVAEGSRDFDVIYFTDGTTYNRQANFQVTVHR